MDSRRDLEQQVLLEEIRKYQIEERNNAEVIGITYILATLIVVIILVMFMQQKSFQRKLRAVLRKCKKSAKNVVKAVTEEKKGSFIDYNPNTPRGCIAHVKAYNKWVLEGVALGAAVPPLPCRCRSYTNTPYLNDGRCSSGFSDIVQEFDEVLEHFHNPSIESFEEMLEQCEDIQQMFNDVMEEKFEGVMGDSFTNTSRFQSSAVMRFAADAEQAKIAANITPSPEVATQAAATAVVAAKNAVASIPETPSPEDAQAAQAAVTAAKNAIADAQKTAAGVPKVPVIAAAAPVLQPTLETKILTENNITDVKTFPSGFPETEPNPPIQDYDPLDNDQYSSLLVNEVADPRTIANHNEWVKEVGNQSTLPMNIMRDGFELSDYHHGIGIRNFSPDRPKSHNYIPIAQEL